MTLLTEPLTEDTEWQHTNQTITDRIKNTENIQNAHLSTVLHLTSLSESDTPEAIAQHAHSIDDNLEKLHAATNAGNTTAVHLTVIHIIEEISTWLEKIEYRVYLQRQNSADGPSEEKFDEHSKLLTELDQIATNVTNLSDELIKTGEIAEPAEQARMQNCFENLQKQVDAVSNITKDSNDELQNEMNRVNEFIWNLESIGSKIYELQTQLEEIQMDDNDAPIDQKLASLDNLEQQLAEQTNEITNSMQIARALARDFPGRPIPVDV